MGLCCKGGVNDKLIGEGGALSAFVIGAGESKVVTMATGDFGRMRRDMGGVRR